MVSCSELPSRRCPASAGYRRVRWTSDLDSQPSAAGIRRNLSGCYDSRPSALVAQRIEHRPPEPCAGVRVAPRAPPTVTKGGQPQPAVCPGHSAFRSVCRCVPLSGSRPRAVRHRARDRLAGAIRGARRSVWYEPATSGSHIVAAPSRHSPRGPHALVHYQPDLRDNVRSAPPGTPRRPSDPTAPRSATVQRNRCESVMAASDAAGEGRRVLAINTGSSACPRGCSAPATSPRTG